MLLTKFQIIIRSRSLNVYEITCECDSKFITVTYDRMTKINFSRSEIKNILEMLNPPIQCQVYPFTIH